MKRLLAIIAICLVLDVSCIKHDNDPGCNVKGTWMGRWTDRNQDGTWVCYANNEGTDLNGYVFVWFDMPMLENRGLGIEGVLKDRQIFFKHYFSGATLAVKGGVDSDSSASGSFDVSNIGMSGTWKGKKMPNLDITVVDSFALDYSAYQLDVACDAVRNHLYISNANEVKEYSYKGNLIRSFNVEKSGRLCFDSNHLWFSASSYGEIIETDTLGEKVSSFDTPNSYCDAIMVDGENLKVSSGYSRKIYSLTKDGASLGSHDFSYLMISGFCKYGNGYLAISHSFPGTIFSVNSLGVPVRAFRFTSGYLRGITIDEGDIWCLSERYIQTNSNPPMPSTSDIKLYRLKLN